MTTIETVLSRMMSEPAFAQQLFADAEKALTGYDLSAEDVTQLKGMSPADFEAFASASPEERKSFGWQNHNETALKIHK